MSRREAAYAVLALFGLGVPWSFNVQYAMNAGQLSVVEFLRLAFANPAAASLSSDVLLAYAVFLVWSVAESRRIGMRRGWLYPLLGALIAFAFAFPLFLLQRERHLRQPVTPAARLPSAPP